MQEKDEQRQGSEDRGQGAADEAQDEVTTEELDAASGDAAS